MFLLEQVLLGKKGVYSRDSGFRKIIIVVITTCMRQIGQLGIFENVP
jgi:hypothetical protein